MTSLSSVLIGERSIQIEINIGLIKQMELNMIPDLIIENMSEQLGKVDRSPSESEKVNQALKKIGVLENDEFGIFFKRFKLSGVLSNRSVELLDLCSPTEQIREATEFGQDAFEIQENFICLSSGEGEGFVLYSKADKNAYDIKVDELDALEAGEKEPSWKSFFELIEWYLS